MNQESEKELEVADPIETEEEAVIENDEAVINEGEDTPEFTDTSAKEEDIEEEPVKETQSKEERAKFANIRRQKEAEDKKIEEAYQKGKNEAFIGKTNPFTNTVIKDYKDVEVYENMYKLAQEDKDPVADYASYIAEKERERDQEEKKQRELEEKASKDIEEFVSKYPNIDLNNLFNDSAFNDYMDGKNKSITEIYEGYIKLKNSFRTESINQAKQTIANSQATPGSLNSISDTTVDYEKMSREDFLKEVERIKNGE